MRPTYLMRHRKTAVGLIVLAVLAIPLPHQVVPAWPLRLIDLQGMPLAGIKTTQTWRHPVYLPKPLNETLTSDAQGRVAFQARAVSVSGLRYLYGALANLAASGTDAGFGPDVWVYAKMDEQYGGSNFYTAGQAPPDTVVIRRYGLCPTASPVY